MKTKIEVPDFVSQQVESFYKEVELDRQKAIKLAMAKAKRRNKISRRNDKMGT